MTDLSSAPATLTQAAPELRFRTRHWVIMLCVALYNILSAAAEIYLFPRLGKRDVSYPADIVMIVRTIAIVHCLVMFASLWLAPWLLRRAAARKAKTGKRGLLFSPETTFMLWCIATFLAPQVYGTLLLHLGDPIFEYYLFAAVSVLAPVIWVMYQKRKAAGAKPSGAAAQTAPNS
jgi:hypothetical protein